MPFAKRCNLSLCEFVIIFDHDMPGSRSFTPKVPAVAGTGTRLGVSLGNGGQWHR